MREGSGYRAFPLVDFYKVGEPLCWEKVGADGNRAVVQSAKGFQVMQRGARRDFQRFGHRALGFDLRRK